MTTLNEVYNNEERMAATVIMLHDEIKLLSIALIGETAPTKPDKTEELPNGFMNAIQARQKMTVKSVILAIDELRFLHGRLTGENPSPTGSVVDHAVAEVTKSAEDLKTEASLADHITFDASSHSLEKE